MYLFYAQTGDSKIDISKPMLIIMELINRIKVHINFLNRLLNINYMT